MPICRGPRQLAGVAIAFFALSSPANVDKAHAFRLSATARIEGRGTVNNVHVIRNTRSGNSCSSCVMSHTAGVWNTAAHSHAHGRGRSRAENVHGVPRSSTGDGEDATSGRGGDDLESFGDFGDDVSSLLGAKAQQVRHRTPTTTVLLLYSIIVRFTLHGMCNISYTEPMISDCCSVRTTVCSICCEQYAWGEILQRTIDACGKSHPEVAGTGSYTCWTVQVLSVFRAHRHVVRAAAVFVGWLGGTYLHGGRQVQHVELSHISLSSAQVFLALYRVELSTTVILCACTTVLL